MEILAVAAGGATGAVMRFFLSTGINFWLGPDFPVGTLVVNVLGSSAMGFLYVLFGERVHVSPELRLALMVGLLGAFTTFSTFSIETLGLLQAGEMGKALTNTVASVVLCTGGCWAGMLLGRVVDPSGP